MNINFKSNPGIIKSKEDMFNDTYMNRLADLIVEEEYSFLLPFIRGFFYITNENRYEKQYNMLKIRFPTEHSKCSMIHDIFIKWKPFEHYNMGECRGTFLELLTFKLLNNKYSEDNVLRESRIIIGDYQSHTWDSIYYYKDILNCYECKFSISHLKRGNLDNMIGILKVNKNISLFIVTLDLKEDLLNDIYLLRGNTGVDVFRELINKFNYVTLEDFINGNPF